VSARVFDEVVQGTFVIEEGGIRTVVDQLSHCAITFLQYLLRSFFPQFDHRELEDMIEGLIDVAFEDKMDWGTIDEVRLHEL
jgi:hypothetical protein